VAAPAERDGRSGFLSTFDENRTLKEELAAKALLRVAPGQYVLPGADRANLGLPLCFRFGKSEAALAVTNGSATYTANTFNGTVSHQYEITQALTAFGAAHTMQTHLIDNAATGALPGFVLDGTTADFASQDNMYSFLMCPVGGQCERHYAFDSCDHASSRLHTHVVTFSSGAGSVTFELRIGESFSSTEPGAFVRARGTFRGTSFEQQDYWKLVYNPAHHHFVRNFAVLFDSPIDGACGIQVTGLEPFDDTGTPNAAAQVDCSLNEGAAIGIESHQHTAPPLP
jgi:hypothetical protein